MTAEWAAYFGLVEDGVGTREAARRVGVNYRTAKRWRAEAAQAAATAVPAAAPAEVSSPFLSLAERIRIADRVREPGGSLRAIAAELGRPVSTITRELARNQHPDGTYQPHAAHEKAAARRARPKVSKLTADPALRAIVQDGLDTRWSPQQISRRLRRDHPDRLEWHVSCETIYQALYVQARGGLRREVAGWLHRPKPRVKPPGRLGCPQVGHPVDNPTGPAQLTGSTMPARASGAADLSASAASSLGSDWDLRSASTRAR